MHKVSLFILILFLGCIFTTSSIAFEEKGGDCTRCHAIKNDEAKDLLKETFPDLNIIDIRPVPMRGLWEVDIEFRGQKGLVYLDFSKQYLFMGSMLSLKDKKNLTQERIAELTKVDVSKIPLDDALIVGAKKAKIRVIVFTDPECPYCAKLHPELKKVVEERKDIVFYIKLSPLPMHPGAYDKSKTILCKKSLKLLEEVFENKPIPKPDCETPAVDNNNKLTQQMGIASRPALVLPDGRVIYGYRDAKALIMLIGQ